MRKFLTSLFFILPCFVFGQLFPELPKVQGKVARITEYQMGKEIRNHRFPESIFKPKINSGWKYTYIFDKNANLVKKISSSLNKIETNYSYTRKTVDDRLIVRETNTATQKEHPDDYVEYENFLNKEKLVLKVNFWDFNGTNKKWGIYQVEQNAEYEKGRLMAFTRYQVDDSGNFSSGERFNLRYNALGKIDQIERINLASGFRTVMNYSYNNHGWIEKSTIDLLTDVQEYKKTQLQEITYKCDREGNWIKRYMETGTKTNLDATRKITYR